MDEASAEKVGTVTDSIMSHIMVGDQVTIENRFGQESTGRVVMRFPTHVVLNREKRK